jgi:restriction system protein
MFKYTYDELIIPTYNAIKNLGGSGTINEIIENIIMQLHLSEEEVDDNHSGSKTKLDYRSAWARTYLKRAGYITNSSRGVWALTDYGNKANSIDKDEVINKAKKIMSHYQLKSEENVDIDLDESDTNEPSWQDDVLAVIKTIEPSKFEKLCQRLLRELGFVNVKVLGRSHDGGIDGKGILKLGSVLAFHVAFQAKRYNSSIGASVIRDFRGAMMGRADKGLVITTANFTSEAKKEAQRDGATTIDLIDGNELAEHLKKLKLGIEVERIEKIIIDKDWFASI